MRRFLFSIFLALAFPSLASAQSTKYIDYASGSNSNPGTKVSPWKTHPYMQTGASCTGSGSAPTYTHTAGDQFIFKGGVSWPAACFTMTIPAGGSLGNVDYYGVDATWFTGGSFTDPIFDLNFNIPTGNFVINFTSGFGGYATFDKLEILHQGIDPAALIGGNQASAAYNFLPVSGSMPGVTIQNGKILDWVAPSSTDIAPIAASCQQCLYYSAGSIYDGHNRVTVNNMTITDTNGYVYKSGVKYNYGFGGGCVNCATLENSTVGGGIAACFSVSSCHDNELFNTRQTAADLCACRPHSQVVEDDYGAIIGMKVYNNYIHDNNPVGVTIYVNYSALVYNNVMKNNSNGNIMIGEPGGAHIGSGHPGGYAVNNTVDGTNGIACFATDSKGTIPGPFSRNNNICVTNGNETAIVSPITIFSNGPTNYKMPTSEASIYGFTAANKYSPSSSDPNVVGKGVNLSSLSSALPGLSQDTAGAPWFGGSYALRSSGSAWVLGAYTTTGGVPVSAPNPPTGLSATVQ